MGMESSHPQGSNIAPLSRPLRRGPTLTYYSSTNFHNTVDHSVNLMWATAYGNWRFSASQSYSSSSDPNLQTGTQTGTQNYGTAFNASYLFNDRISTDLQLGQNLNYIASTGNTNLLLQNLGNTLSWTAQDWLNYQFWPRLNAGIGVSAGYNHEQGTNNPDSVFEQYQARVNWRATDKISLELSGGLYDQQYMSGGASPLISPVFNATIQYQPFEHTEVSVSAGRTVSTSDYQAQMIKTTTAGVDLTQQLFGRLNLDLSFDYNKSDYSASLFGLGTSRSDSYYSVNARLICPVLKRGTASVFYQYASNSSSQTGFLAPTANFGYTSHQIGFEFSYRY
jgi:hypothetical protein